MDHPLDGIQEKLNRGKEQLELIFNEADAFMNEGEPYRIVGEFDHERWAWIERVKVEKLPPLRLGVLLGECIHNWRSALDHLVWQLTLLDGGRPDGRTQFPITKTESQFNRQARKRIPGLSPAHRAVVEKAQPYKAADASLHPLAVLADISNTDKHKIVNPTFGHLSDQTVTPLARTDHHRDRSPVKRILMAPSGRRLEDGTELFVIQFWPSEEPPARVNMGGDITLDVAFGERAVSWHSLPAIGTYVKRVIEAFLDDFSPLP